MDLGSWNDPECDKQGSGMAVKVWHGGLHGSSGRWGEQERLLYNHPGGPNSQINRLSIGEEQHKKTPSTLLVYQ